MTGQDRQPLAWRPYELDATAVTESLTGLFRAAFASGADPNVLCRIAIDLQRGALLSGVAVDAFTEIAAMHPSHIDAHVGLAQSLRIAGRLDEALCAAGSALALDPHGVGSQLAAAKIHRDVGELERSIELLEVLRIRSPLVAETMLCEIHLERGDLGSAQEVWASIKARDSHDTGTIALAHVLRAATFGETDLLEPFDEDLVLTCRPAGRTSAELNELNARLAAELACCAEQLVFEPPSTATENGAQAMLNALPLPSANIVVEMIQEIVVNYVDLLAADHPFAKRRPSELSITAWSVVLSERGRQQPHIHPAAWLSGVYYVQVPSFENDSVAGALELGRLPPDLIDSQLAESLTVVRPSAGDMVLFPSYVHHQTIPHGSGPARICIAFDIG